MPPVKSRECTEVFFGVVPDDREIKFEQREVPVVHHFDQRHFKSQDRFDVDHVAQALLELQKMKLQEKVDAKLAKLRERQVRPSTKRKQKPSWKQKVTSKRLVIQRCIENSATLNLSQVARLTKSSFETVKKVHQNLQMYGQAQEYSYNFTKKTEDIERLDESILLAREGFLTISDLKRRNTSFSRRFIGKRMKESGLRYRLMPKKRKLETPRHYSSTQVCRLVSHITQALSDSSSEMLYVDEVKFPLVQTAEKRWCNAETFGEIVYNRRSVPDKTITAIAMCSTTKFEAVQFFANEVTGVDFLGFMNKAISSLPSNKTYTVVLDNATWHRAGIVESSTVNKYLVFNQPGLFQMNLIENAFSFIRHAFRKRPVFETDSDEVRHLTAIFFDAANEAKFQGILRNHIRVLMGFLEKYADRE